MTEKVYASTRKDFENWYKNNIPPVKCSRMKFFKQKDLYMEMDIREVNGENYAYVSICRYSEDSHTFSKIKSNKWERHMFELRAHMYAFKYNIMPYSVVWDG